MDLSSFTPDQRKAVKHLDGPLLVCAGAGTGKTFTLTQRIAWALVGNPEEGVPPFLGSIDETLVITYTNKAAAELKGRFRAALRSVGCFEDALKVDGAWVSTIHGMCSRILREHALELGIDPAFELAIGAEADDAMTLAINESIHDARDYDTYQPLFDEYETYGVRSMLERLLGDAACQTRGLDAFDLGPGPTDTDGLLRQAIEAAEEAASIGKGKTADRAANAAQKLAEYQQEGADPEKLPELLKSLELGLMRGDSVAKLKSTLAALKDAVLLNRAWDLMQLLMRLARKVEANYQAILARNCKVDTSDLIRKTLAAFDEHPEIARQYTERFKLIMVDEFQDTSQLQIDMIERIAGPGRPRLCTVGDSQQSIYRFQGADVSVYLKHKQDMREDGALMVELQDNFRSNADILSFVRAVCGKPGFFVEDFLDLRAGSDGRCYKGTGPRVELVVTLHDNGCTDDAVEEEARHIAARFRALLDEGHSPSDMVVLMGTTTKMESYAKALRDQGIPCMAAGGSKYYQASHVKCCLSLLDVLANPLDSNSMMDVLSSEVLPVSSSDLLHLATYRDENSGMFVRQNFAQAFLYDGRAPQQASALLEHAMCVLRRAWKKLGTVRPSELFLQTVIDTGWIDRLNDKGESGQAMIADIMKMVRLVETAQQSFGFDMARVASALHASASSDSESPGVLSVEGLQAVRLMTVHSSKGLEFPIVAVTNCFTSRVDSGALRTVAENGCVHASLMPKGEKLGCQPQFGDVIPLGSAANLAEQRAQIEEVDRRRSEAERRRLFYVAATRATDALIVAMHKTRTSNLAYKELEADLLSALFPGQADFPETSGTFDYSGSEPGAFTRVDVRKKDNVPDDDECGDNADDSTDERSVPIPQLDEPSAISLEPRARRIGFFSYSSIAPHDVTKGSVAFAAHEAKEPGDDLIAASAPVDWDKATDFGSALHRTLEWMALQGGAVDADETMSAIRRFMQAYGVKNEPRLIAAVERWAESDIARRAYAFSSCEPEVPFCIQAADGYLEGEIDLLCHDGDDHAFVVDYKTGGNPEETPVQLQGKHQLQAQCYAYAVLNAGYRTVELHFVRVEQPCDDACNQPQIVSYRYASEDLPSLGDAIAKAKVAAQ